MATREMSIAADFGRGKKTINLIVA